MRVHTLALTVLALSMTFASSVQAQKQSHDLGALDIRVLMHPQAGASSAARPGSNALAQGLASPGNYRFASVDFPGAPFSECFDINGSTSVGAFSFNPSGSPQQAFTLQYGFYKALNVPGARGSIATGINKTGEIVGAFEDGFNVTHGFVHIGANFSAFDAPGATVTEIFDVNDSGELVGGFADALGTHGFTFNGAFQSVDFPGATSTTVTAVNSAGELVGTYIDAANLQHGFALQAGVFTSIDFPLSPGTVALGINDAGTISGFFNGASTFHGFIYSEGAFNQIDVAGATQTEVAHIKNDGKITGEYIDTLNEAHGLTGR